MDEFCVMQNSFYLSEKRYAFLQRVFIKSRYENFPYKLFNKKRKAHTNTCKNKYFIV